MLMAADLLDGTTEQRHVNPDEVLGPVIIPAYYEAGALTGAALTDLKGCDYQIIVVAPAHASVLEGASQVGVELHADSKRFAQLLAKIALGIAVAALGVKGFVPTVRNFILNNPDEYGYWVGGFAGTPMANPASNKLHNINLKTRQTAAGAFIIVEIQLFAEFGGPVNYVLVGRPLNPPQTSETFPPTKA